MEKIEVIGNLTKDPELRESKTGKKYCNFTVAANSNIPVYNADGTYGTRKTTNYYRVTVWGKQAEVCAQYLKKSRKVRVYGTFSIEFARDPSTGKLIYRNNPDGTKSDEPLMNLNIRTQDDVEFLSNMISDNAGTEQPAPSATENGEPATPKANGMTQVDVDDELPF